MASFEADFEVLTGNSPLPWQAALFEAIVGGAIPAACDLPTGLGKTSVIPIWLLALAAQPTLPRRLVYVVNRRTVVDQATREAERIRDALKTPSLAHVKAALEKLGVLTSNECLAISTLRGEFADNATWRDDPSRASIIVGTIDMVGSRLLFSGYGCGYKSRPLHASFIGHDSLVVHDEAHLEPAFQDLLEQVARVQSAARESRPVRVMQLTATTRATLGAPFTLSPEDLSHPLVKRRLRARKGLKVHRAPNKELAERLAELAKEKSGAVLIFSSKVDQLHKCVSALGKVEVRTLTGTMRGLERDELARTDPVFARFLPEKSRPREVQPKEGTVFLVATSAGEVGIDISADHLVTDLSTFESIAQRLGRVNRYGDGDAEVELVAENELVSVVAGKPEDDEEDEDEEEADPTKAARSRRELARRETLELLARLPTRPDGRHDVSPAALRAVPAEARAVAFCPAPRTPHLDEILLDRWTFTTVRGRLAGRPPVDDWLHGAGRWEEPRTTVAWRNEVAWTEEQLLDPGAVLDLLDDYPLRARERLSDTTDRVAKELKKVAARFREGLRVWLSTEVGVEVVLLADLLQRHDRQQVLEEATILLPPSAGGLTAEGLLNGNEEQNANRQYDVASLARQGETQRQVTTDPVSERAQRPAGMRFVRAIRLGDPESDGATVWRLWVRPAAADDDGSRTTTREVLTLSTHLSETEFWARQLTSRLQLSAMEAKCVVQAGAWHDLGKKRAVWQRSIRNLAFPERVALAKAPVGMDPAELGHYRHELGSLHDAESLPEYPRLTAEERDLLLHLVAAHHGRARPFFPRDEVLDPEAPPGKAEALAAEVPLRFARLQRRFGRWGLAWLESLVRVADYLASTQELPR